MLLPFNQAHLAKNTSLEKFPLISVEGFYFSSSSFLPPPLFDEQKNYLSKSTRVEKIRCFGGVQGVWRERKRMLIDRTMDLIG